MTTTTDRKRVYRLTEGSAQMVDLLGSKGAHVSEMARIGIPVPPGFVITTEACLEYYQLGHRFPDGLWEAVVRSVHELEQESGKGFGDAPNPLVVSVRSGAAVSMPGMMDTILNLGLSDQTVPGLAGLMGDERATLDAQRRLIQGFAGVVMGVAIARVVAAYAGWPTVVTATSILLSTSVSVTVGLVSGMYPAVRAAELDPIDALRYE